MTPAAAAVPGSFRDPSGFVFLRDGEPYRQVNQPYRGHYDRLLASGLAAELQEQGLLIGHREVDLGLAAAPGAYRVLRPEKIPFISYPYEWCFGQLRDAALLTLEVQKKALARGLWLKDASAFNVQFLRGRPLLIDTLSFEIYPEGRPWVAYRQFCQHFLAPLALMARRDVRLGRLLQLHLDGIPLDLAAALLPFATRLRIPLLSHIHLHARAQRRWAGRPRPGAGRPLSRFALLALVDSLEGAVRGLRWNPRGGQWGDYYDKTNYSPAALEEKKRLVASFLRQAAPGRVLDLGANTGLFSRLATGAGIPVVALDSDPEAVERNYRQCRSEGDPLLLPLVGDVTNPSPGIGWENNEREPLLGRAPADAVLALALVHHLAIANNLPLGRIAALFRGAGRFLIVEFVPKDDSQAQRLLASREDVFPDYHLEGFERDFLAHFTIERREAIAGSGRILYLMRRRGAG